MHNPNPALLPSPALFDVTTVAAAPVEGTIDLEEVNTRRIGREVLPLVRAEARV